MSSTLGEYKYSLKKLKIRRIIHSLRINSFESISEQFTLTYMNLDDRQHFILPLPTMRKIVQRSLKVFDRSGNELTILPSYEIYNAFRKLSMQYLNEIKECMGDIEHNTEFNKKITRLKCDLRNIFRYGNNEEEINHAIEIFVFLSPLVESLIPEYRGKCRKLLLELAYLVNLQKDTYIPFVELKESFPQKEHYSIHYVVETTRPLWRKRKRISPYIEGRKDRFLLHVRRWKDRLLFYVAGRIDSPISLLPASAPSYHLEVMPPKGVDICDFRFEGLESDAKKRRSNKIIENKREKDRYFDKELLYITFSPDETKEIRNCMYEGKTPSVILNLRINPLLRSIYYLVYVAVFLPLIITVAHGNIDLPDLLASLALAATIYISASIYAIDKKIVQKFALFHFFVTILSLFMEIVMLRYFF